MKLFLSLAAVFAGLTFVALPFSAKELAPGTEPKKLAQKVEYDLLPVCVEQIVVNNKKWHCIVDDPDDPKGIYCDEGSMTIVLKKTADLKTCTQVHIVVEKGGKP